MVQIILQPAEEKNHQWIIILQPAEEKNHQWIIILQPADSRGTGTEQCLRLKSAPYTRHFYK